MCIYYTYIILYIYIYIYRDIIIIISSIIQPHSERHGVRGGGRRRRRGQAAEAEALEYRIDFKCLN